MSVVNIRSTECRNELIAWAKKWCDIKPEAVIARLSIESEEEGFTTVTPTLFAKVSRTTPPEDRLSRFPRSCIQPCSETS